MEAVSAAGAGRGGQAAAAATTGGGSWRPDSWRERPIQQQPEYEDPEELAAALAKVGKLPIVHQMEIEKLKSYLALATQGKMFPPSGAAPSTLPCAIDPSVQSLQTA